MDIQILKQIVSSLTAIVMAMQTSLASLPNSTQLAQVIQTATLSLSPSSTSATVNNTFTVNIVLNTGGQAAYGADINLLRFNPSILQVVDADAVTSGTQIAAGSIMPLTLINIVNNTTGTIQFSQLATPGSTFSGSGTLATITFRAVSTGTSNANFDFTLGSGTDSNVAGLGGDLLASVVTGSYTVSPAPDTTLPSAPGTPSLTVVSSSRIDLSWTSSTDNVGVTGYRLERCSGLTTCTSYAQIATPSVNSYSDTGLSASTIYRYRVRAVDAAGNLSSYSNEVNATTQAPPDTTAPVISNVTVSNITTSGATIAWTTNEGSDTQVEYGTTVSYGSQSTLNSSMITSHSATLSSLAPAVTYNFRVRSRDAAGNLSLSSNSQFTTASLADTTAPSVPSGLTATPTNESQIQLSWNASTDPTSTGQTISGVREYQVFRWGSLIGTTTSTAYLNTGLTANTLYSYQVAAVDNAGNVSSRSSSVSATTPIFSLSVQRRILVTPEGTPSNQKNISGTVKFLNPLLSNTEIYEASFVSNTSGQYVVDVPAGLPPTVNFRVVVAGYLSKILNSIDLRNSSLLDVTIPTLPAGDFNGDNIINSLDFSYMNSRWASADTLSDLNRDNTVNSLDFAYLSNNWLAVGE